MIFGTIYCLEFPNNKNYIGQTHDSPENRFKIHCRDALNNNSEYPVHRAIRKYKKENVIIHTICNANSQEELDNLEIKYITEYNSFIQYKKGYNQTIGGGGTVGYKFTEDQRNNVIKAQHLRNIKHPEIAINQKEFMINKHKEHPEIAITHSKFMKNRSKEHPEIGLNHSKFMTKLYDEHPEMKNKMSEIKLKQNKERPNMAIQQAEIKNELYSTDKGKEIIKKLSIASINQWKDPDYRKRSMDKRREKYTIKNFCSYKDGVAITDENGKIKIFNYIPDCSLFIYNKQSEPNIGAILRGERNNCKGYTFKFCD